MPVFFQLRRSGSTCAPLPLRLLISWSLRPIALPTQIFQGLSLWVVPWSMCNSIPQR